jgi:CRP/FNR family cyclic AMP-dependent transcriptional regulator
MDQGFPDLLIPGDHSGLTSRRPEQEPRRTRRQTAVALARIPMFADLSKKQLNRLAAESEELVFHPGQVVVKEGDPGETLFVVLSGQAKVQRGKRKVGEILPGDFFGELSAIDGDKRTASVVADTPLRVVRLFRHTLTSLIEDEPQVILKLLDGIVRRFRQVEHQSQSL